MDELEPDEEATDSKVARVGRFRRFVSFAKPFAFACNCAVSSKTDSLRLARRLLFVFASAVLILGVGTSYNPVACKLGIWVSLPFKT